VRMLIPASRLRWIPKNLRLAHEYCFFLHDEIARLLVEYEVADAPKVTFKFASKAQGRRFELLAKQHDPVTAMRELGLHSEARRVVMNQITMAMVSDCAHHIYEALQCFEKRKFIPGFNLLRKPLLDSLMYLTWIAADEDDFYSKFSSGDPTKLAQKLLGNRRRELFAAAIAQTELADDVAAEDLITILFDASNPDGLYWLFQHAVHLITVDRIELKTSSENFNFIFKNPYEDDLYETLYLVLPTALLYLAHVILILYERIGPASDGAKAAFVFRSLNAYRFLHYQGASMALARVLEEALSSRMNCEHCATPLTVTEYNAIRLLMTESFRCTRCRHKQPFPLSWMF
jgi:hypothetical protein